jgi:hypothetical protein
MAVLSNQVSVTTIAVQVVPPTLSGIFPPGRDGPPIQRQRNNNFSNGPSRFISIKNLGPSIVNIGKPNLSIEEGVPISINGILTFWLNWGDELWGIVGTGTATVSYIETGG